MDGVEHANRSPFCGFNTVSVNDLLWSEGMKSAMCIDGLVIQSPFV